MIYTYRLTQVWLHMYLLSEMLKKKNMAIIYAIVPLIDVFQTIFSVLILRYSYH